jgi:pimeloyl-[acyl-carrier protein] methyl ester esterase
MKKISIKIIGQGLPLVLVHGWGWNSDIWLPLAAKLAWRFQLFLVDIPCFDKFEDISKQLFPKLPSAAVWLGWSLGGMYAWWAAIHHPERITHLITVASSPKFCGKNNWPGIPVTTLEKFSQTFSNNPQKTLIDFLKLQLRGSEQQDIIFNAFKQPLEKKSSNDIPAFLKGLTLLKETDLRSDLTKITCPNLHIFGQNDTLISTKIIPFINKYTPLSHSVIIKRAGHIPFLTHPGDFIKNLYGFLKL